MAETLPCKCGAVVPFEDEDRGLEVYCPSCGKVCLVPAEGAEALPPPSVPENDAASGLRKAATQTSPAATPTTSPATEPKAFSASDQAATGRVSSSIFSRAATVDVADRYIDEVACLCGTKIPVRIKDFGAAVYCPSCASEVRVGEDLERARASRARAVTDEEAGSAAIPKV